MAAEVVGAATKAETVDYSVVGVVANTLLSLTKQGDHVLSFVEMYGPTRHLVRRTLGKFGDTEFEVCCIPLLLYDISLGDIVATDADYLLDRVVRPSGRYTFRVWFGDDGAGPALRVGAHRAAVHRRPRLVLLEPRLLHADAHA